MLKWFVYLVKSLSGPHWRFGRGVCVKMICVFDEASGEGDTKKLGRHLACVLKWFVSLARRAATSDTSDRKPENPIILGFSIHLGDEYYTVLFI